MTRTDHYAAQNATLAKLQKQFPGQSDCYISSHKSPGRVTQVSLANAARLITDGTHRIATREEVAEFQKQQELARAQSLPVDGLAAARRLFNALGQGERR